MFTGIVTQRAEVASVRKTGRGSGATVRLVVRLERPVERLAVGHSLALDGVCLTAVEVDGPSVAFDVIPETLRRTTLGRRVEGDRVNVEAALRVGDALGGHLVQGHVDGVGVVDSVSRGRGDVRMTVRLPEALRGATIEKGSVAIDGVSLTVGESEDDAFAVYLIPHTLVATGLDEKKPGDEVNLEADLVGRWVAHHVMRLSDAMKSEAPPRRLKGKMSGGPNRRRRLKES